MLLPLTVTKERSHSHDKDNSLEYGLRMTALQSDGSPANIFVWQKQDGPSGDMFVTVASPLDITDTPENEPDIENGQPYYRTNIVELWFRNFEDFDFYSMRLDYKIRNLVTSLRGLDRFSDVEVITV